MRGYVVVFEGDDEVGYSAYSLTCLGSWRLDLLMMRPSS
jgi:hypothetical protein